MILLTMVVFPALSRPLLWFQNAKLAPLLWRDLQHEDPHLLILQPGFSEDGQHLARDVQPKEDTKCTHSLLRRNCAGGLSLGIG